VDAIEVASTLLSKKIVRKSKKSDAPACAATGKPLPVGAGVNAWVQKTLVPYGALPEAVHGRLAFDGVFFQQVKDALTELILDQKRKEEAEKKSLCFDDIKCEASKLILVQIPDSKDSCLLYDPINDMGYPYSTKAAEARVESSLGKELFESWVHTNRKFCYARYRPDLNERFFKGAGDHLCYNTYQKPEWLEKWSPKPANLPAELEHFFNHLFPIEDDRKFSLLFARDAVFKRAKPVQVLRGFRGCGKNIYAQHLLQALVGHGNWAKHTRKSTGFDKIVGRKQVYIYDELPLDNDLKETLKDYHNAFSTLQEKFEKVEEPQELYASFLVLQNHKSKVHLDYSDRKFYAPKLADVDYLDVIEEGKIDRLCRVLLKDKDFLTDTANYLYHLEGSTSDFNIYTENFLDICWTVLPVHLKKFFVMAVSESEFDSKRYYGRSKGFERASYENLVERAREFALARGLPSLGEFKRQNPEIWTFESHVVGRTDLVPQGMLYGGGDKDGTTGI